MKKQKPWSPENFFFRLEMKEVSTIENQAQDMQIQTRKVKER